MDDAEVKQAVTDFLTKKSTSAKKMFYLSDIAKAIGIKKKELKKPIQEMIEAGEVEPWSSGSTTYYMLPGARDVENI